MTPVVNVIKNFYDTVNTCKISSSFGSCLIFALRSSAYPRVEQLERLAKDKHCSLGIFSQEMSKKKFCNIVTRAQCYETFVFSNLQMFVIGLEFLSLASLSSLF